MSKATKSGADPTISYNPSGGGSTLGSLSAPATPERFKEICLRPGGESSREALAVLDYLFNADTFLDRPMVGVNLIKQYLTGGGSYETFKSKCKTTISFLSVEIERQFNLFNLNMLTLINF
jgi:hypothetical protein